MKKKMILLTTLCMFVCCAMFCSCSSTMVKLDNVKSIFIGDDYTKAGYTLGKATYTAYTYLKTDSKYDKYTNKCEEVYADAVATGKCDITMINSVALVICEEALAKKYGTLEAQLIIMGIRIAGGIADNIISGKIDQEKASQFVSGFMAGIRDSVGIVTVAGDEQNAIEKASGKEIESATDDDEPFVCRSGNCHIVGMDKDKSIAFQRKVVLKLLNEYAEPETKIDEVTNYENIVHLRDRLDVLERNGKKNTKIYVSAFIIKDNKLTDLLLLCDIDEPGTVCKCVSCYPIEEELDMKD